MPMTNPRFTPLARHCAAPSLRRSLTRVLPFAGLAAVALSVATPAHATPSLLGFYPSSDIFADQIYHLNVTTYGAAFKTNIANSVGLSYGLGDRDKPLGRTEFGFDYLTNGSGLGLSTQQSVFGNVKTQLYNNSDSGTRLVAGGWLLGDSSANANVVYLLGAKAFDFGRVHVGYARALTKGIYGQANYLQLGYDRAITDRILFAADFYSGGSAISGVQPSVYYAINDKASFGIGIFRANSSASSPRYQTYIGFDYNFGGPVNSPPSQGSPGAPGEGGLTGAAGDTNPTPNMN